MTAAASQCPFHADSEISGVNADVLSGSSDQIRIAALQDAADYPVVTSVLMSEMFSTDVRFAASGTCYNITYAVFGGTAPFVATWLVAGTGYSLSPAIYVSAIAVASFLVATFLIPETAGRPLRRYHDDPVPAERARTVASQAVRGA